MSTARVMVPLATDAQAERDAGVNSGLMLGTAGLLSDRFQDADEAAPWPLPSFQTHAGTARAAPTIDLFFCDVAVPLGLGQQARALRENRPVGHACGQPYVGSGQRRCGRGARGPPG